MLFESQYQRILLIMTKALTIRFFLARGLLSFDAMVGLVSMLLNSIEYVDFAMRLM